MSNKCNNVTKKELSLFRGSILVKAEIYKHNIIGKTFIKEIAWNFDVLKKSEDGNQNIRVYIDFRGLNSATKKY